MISSLTFDAFTKKINNYVANHQNFTLEDHTNMWIDIWRSGKELTDLKEAFDKKYGMYTEKNSKIGF